MIHYPILKGSNHDADSGHPRGAECRRESSRAYSHLSDFEMPAFTSGHFGSARFMGVGALKDRRRSHCVHHLHFYRKVTTVEVQGEHMGHEKMALPQGTLDLLILRTLALEPQHGWAISERVQQTSSAVLQIPQGSLYPALHRLERRGWIKARWGTSDNNRRAKYYELTMRGRRQLQTGQAAWRKMTAAVATVLQQS